LVVVEGGRIACQHAPIMETRKWRTSHLPERFFRSSLFNLCHFSVNSDFGYRGVAEPGHGID
jgi:hypothetical protein